MEGASILRKTDMGEPLVSVVIPAFNAGKYIGDALGSIVSQSYVNHEIIVVDDGSTDNTESLINENYPSVRLMRQRNLGPAAARNKGIINSKGKYIAFLDADDVWLPEKLEKSVKALEADSAAALVYSGRCWVGEYLQPIDIKDKPEFYSGDVYYELFMGNFISTTSVVVVRKSVFDELGLFNEDQQLRVCEDYEMWLRIADRFPIRSISQALVLYRLHTSNTHSNIAKLMTGLIKTIEIAEKAHYWEKIKKKERLKIFRTRYCRIHKESAHSLFYNGDYVSSRENFIKAHRHHLFDVECFFYISLLSLFPKATIDFLRKLRKRVVPEAGGG